MSSSSKIREWRDVDARAFRQEIATRYEPAVLRSVIAHWPAVKQWLASEAQSALIADCLPRFAAENALSLLHESIRPRIWLGTQVVTPAHFDESANVACVVAGRRRFTHQAVETFEHANPEQRAAWEAMFGHFVFKRD